MTRKISIPIMLYAAMLISSCNFPLLSQPTEEPNTLATSVAQTIEAMGGQPLPTQPPPDQAPTSPAGLPTTTPVIPTAAVPVVQLPTATPLPCDKAQFVSETIPDDTEFAPGEAFSKSWMLKNTGTCTWNTNYKLIFSSGDAMGAPSAVNFSKSTAPNEQLTLQVAFKAPATAGTYSGTWKLQAENGTQFGTVTVKIKVPTQAFAVTSVKTNLANVSPGACPPYTYPVDISIVTSAAGKVTYQVETSTGGVGAVKNVTFDAAGTKVVEMDFSGLGVAGSSTEYWLRVYIQQPNNQWFGPYKFNVTCP